MSNFLSELWGRLGVEPAYRASKRLSRRGLYAFLAGQTMGLGPGDRVLSVGAGGQVGELLARRAGAAGFGLEQLDQDPGRGPDILADICAWSGEGVYDAVFMAEVLEHVADPQRAVANLLDSLKPGGRLVITVPFVFPIHDAPHDHFRYTRHGLEKLLAACRELKVTERNSWAEALVVLLARTATAPERGLRLAAPFLVLAAFALQPLAWLAGRAMPSGFITTGYLVTARK